jgi:putative peptide zinc metalloprotease protein
MNDRLRHSEQPALVLPFIRQDLRLYPGSAQQDGSPSWRILDPVRNSFYEIGWLEFELLARWREHKDAASLIAHVSAETTLRPVLDEVQELVAFLANHQLLGARSPEARQALERRVHTRERAWYEQLAHHYLFFRLPLFRPDRFLSNTVGLTDVFFTRGFFLVLAVLFAFDIYLVSREWFSFTAAMGRVLTPHGFVYYALALSFAKIVHEHGHAYAAKRYGVRVPTMGLAFLVLWPYLYTDTSESWKLADRRKQLVIAVAGMAAEVSLAVVCTFLWALSPEGAARSVFFVLASTTWVMTLAINVSPFMRFDGYFVLSDLLDFPNLHERSFACARWWMRKTFFGLVEPTPEPTLRAGQRAWLIAFAYGTWLYRFTVFIGIALLVYHVAFKLLGIVLMMIEIIWFVARPVWNEVAYLWRARSAVQAAWRPVALVAALVALFVWVVPISYEVSAPAILRAEQEHALYAPFAAKITAVLVRERQQVRSDQELVSLQALDRDVRETKADIRIAAVQSELSRVPTSLQLQENYQVLREQLAQAEAEKQAVIADSERERVRAPHAGTVRDIATDLTPGRWISPRQLLMRIVSPDTALIEAYVNERQVAAIQVGQTVRFFPHLPDRPVIDGEVLAVDKSPHTEVSRPLLASVYGGAIDVKQGPRGSLMAQDAVFRVLIKPSGALPPAQAVVHGQVRIETQLRFVVENFVYRTLSVLIRESGL